MQQYRVLRVFRDRPGRGRVLRKGLSLAEAREWCGNPETSSRTAKPTPYRRRYLATNGEWMDVYVRE